MALFHGSLATAQSQDSQAPQQLNYKLEALEVVGTDRLTQEQAAEEFGLKPGADVDDELVLQTRQRVLSMGTFKSAVLLLKRGSQRGLVRLIIQVEDDPNVLTSWGLGGEVGLTYTDRQAASGNTDGPPIGYRLGIVARSLFGTFHRASGHVDLDGEGVARSIRLIYGLPRFAAEDVQFDIEAQFIDVSHRYLEAAGFGTRVQAMWTTSLGDYDEVRYGTAMYLNRGRFKMPTFPSSLAGPKIGYSYETRLNGFLPGAGELVSASLLYAPIAAQSSVAELELAKTYQINESVWTTFLADYTGVGVNAFSARFETRFDFAVTESFSRGDQAEIYLRLRAGQDEANRSKFTGSSALLGLRYHSSGLIADIGFHITRSPFEIGIINAAPVSGAAQ